MFSGLQRQPFCGQEQHAGFGRPSGQKTRPRSARRIWLFGLPRWRPVSGWLSWELPRREPSRGLPGVPRGLPGHLWTLHPWGRGYPGYPRRGRRRAVLWRWLLWWLRRPRVQKFQFQLQQFQCFFSVFYSYGFPWVCRVSQDEKASSGVLLSQRAIFWRTRLAPFEGTLQQFNNVESWCHSLQDTRNLLPLVELTLRGVRACCASRGRRICTDLSPILVQTGKLGETKKRDMGSCPCAQSTDILDHFSHHLRAFFGISWEILVIPMPFHA